jgi:hypothetical protein
MLGPDPLKKTPVTSPLYVPKKQLGEAVVSAQAPDWLRFQREFDLEEFVKKGYQNPVGQDKIKKINPRALIQELVQRGKRKRQEQVANKLAGQNPQGSMSRGEWLNTFDPKEQEILTSVPKYQTSLWQDTKRGVQAMTEMNPAMSVANIARSGAYSAAEKAQMIGNYAENPNSARVMDAMGVFSPLAIPGKMVQSAVNPDYTLDDALSGTKNNASLAEDILLDPLNLVGTGIAAGAFKTARAAQRGMKTGARMSGIVDDAAQAGSDIPTFPINNPMTGEPYSFIDDFERVNDPVTIRRSENLNLLGDYSNSQYENLYAKYETSDHKYFSSNASNQRIRELMNSHFKLEAGFPFDLNDGATRNYVIANLVDLFTQKNQSLDARIIGMEELKKKNSEIYTEVRNRISNRIGINEPYYDPNSGERYLANTTINTPKKVKNRSNYEKTELSGIVNEPDEILKYGDEQFENTVITPKGEIKPYFIPENKREPWNEFEKATNSTREDMSRDEYIDLFNSNLDRLNKIIADNNTSGFDYRIKGLEMDGYNSKLVIESESGTTSWNVGIVPGKFKGEVADLQNEDYYQEFIPGLNMHDASKGVFGSGEYGPKGTKAYKSINDYLKEMGIGRVKPGFNSQKESSRELWKKYIQKDKAYGYFANRDRLIFGSMRTLAPYTIPLGAGVLSQQGKKQ